MSNNKRKRHRARVAEALEQRRRAQSWCEQRGWYLYIHDAGAQWSVHHHGNITDWWPSTGKLVHNKQWDRAGKAMNWDAVAEAFASMEEQP